MSPGDNFDPEPALPQTHFQAALAILDDCRAARIEEVTAFANCLVTTSASCPHRLAFNSLRYCVHPQREAIIARTLAAEPPPGA